MIFIKVAVIGRSAVLTMITPMKMVKIYSVFALYEYFINWKKQ